MSMPRAPTRRRATELGSGTTEAVKLVALLSVLVKAPEARSLEKVTVEPAPMEREVRDWLTEENFREVVEPVTEMEAGVVKAPERLVVPLVIWREE